ncbi:hypothetical protein ARMGADRAFT_1086501 [Armillaria gallica]|uniref:Uncharacterized protein n=1 Tax=Armillaria gallica TaxID=47427 RepID=A0A2H3DEI6_ARMGA|nr:hypothetical protein ARMGADRAFT_1086501 [Armillaria gallica]
MAKIFVSSSMLGEIANGTRLMPFRIGGYYQSFSMAQKIMEKLKIPNPYDYGVNLLKFAINYWLCEQDKMDGLAAYI